MSDLLPTRRIWHDTETGLVFDMDVKTRVLTVTMTPEKYWPMWEEFRRAPCEEHDAEAQKTLRDIATVAEGLYRDHGQFEIRVQTVHMGALAHERLTPA